MKEKTREVNITSRDKKIIELISLGYTDKEIAKALKLSYSAVRASCSYIQMKTNTINRPHLISWAYKNNILF